MDLLRWLATFGTENLGKLKTVVDLIAQIRDADSLEARVTLALQLLRVLAQISPTTVDDQILDVINRVATPELIAKLVSLLGRFSAESVTTMSADDEKQLVDVAHAQSMSLLQLFALLRTVKQIIDMISPMTAI